MKMINVKQYFPQEPLFGDNVLYLQDENGVDWYDSQSKFDETKIKILVDKENVIVSASKDITMLVPFNLSVYEVDDKNVSDEIGNGKWMYVNGAVVERTYSESEIIEQNKVQKASLLQHAAEAIAPLQDAVDLDMATEAEKQLLADWKIYRVLVNRVDCSKPVWPEMPV